MPPLATALFDYPLPPHLIAQTPAARRDQSRLLVVERATRRLAHHTFSDLPRFLRPGDILFRNNAAVLPARLHAQRPTGGRVECLLLRPAEAPAGAGTTAQLPDRPDGPPASAPRQAAACTAASSRPTPDPETWRCLVRPGKKLPIGATFAHASGSFAGEIIAKDPDGSALVRFTARDGESIAAIANRLGDVPLPPYISRTDESHRAEDRERYQTVYADPAHQVAVAAPTAGLHFTPELLATLAAQGVRTAEVTLHVGLGTFRPITTDAVEAHVIHRELYEVPATTQRSLFPPFAGRRIAIGTTTVRSVEHFLAHHAGPLDHPHLAEADTFIHPPRTFCGVDALITNFHQPRSTLLCLVAAFLTPGSTDGAAWIREIYAEAIAREYRFFSYGDAMLIL